MDSISSIFYFGTVLMACCMLILDEGLTCLSIVNHYSLSSL